ncbi:MAG TPA: NAD(P)-dependent alcohol dehydrogenase [Turneriella sp.]|nr:NAD(P)-dependent alcohol dehydrogenase [Turneriella sp.]
MKTAYRAHYCQPEQLAVKEVPDPKPAADQLLVRVRATTVNRTDCAVLTAKPFIMRFFIGFFKPKLPVPGTDFAGEIVAVGSSVTQFKPGDRVFGFNDKGLASQAELMAIAANAPLAKIPHGLSFEQAAASLEAAHYAYNFANKLKLKAGQNVLVNGASGGIGSALVQILKHFGVIVTAVCNGKNVERVRALGAAKVIDYEREDFTRLTEKFDFVLDAVGKSTFGKCKHLLKDKGVYLSSELGPGGQNIFLPLITAPWGGRRVVFPIPGDIPGSIAFICSLLTSGAFKPVIDRTYPLADIAAAYRYVMTGQKTGNVVILYS